MKIYLSGPMTGLPNWNYPAFNKRASHIRSQGNEVFNPAEQFQGDTDLPWIEYMRADIASLLECDKLYALEGWDTSIGARLEVIIAVAIGLPVEVEGYDGIPFHNEDPRKLVERFMRMSKQDTQTPAGKETILEEAQRLVHGDRGEAYGHPFDDFSKTAQIWQPILGTDVTPEQVAMCMIGVKISRQLNKPKRDNVTDIAGYAETLQMCVDYRQNSQETVTK